MLKLLRQIIIKKYRINVLQNAIQCITIMVMKGGVYMAAKTANVTARIQPDIKESAEAILEKLGIPVSVFIDMTYRQVIATNGIPFELKTSKALVTRDTMTDAQFNSMMKTGLAQAVSDDSSLAKDVFEELRKRV